MFFVNVPVAVGVAALSPVLLCESRATDNGRRFDLAGAVTITAALVALVYAVVKAPELNNSSFQIGGAIGVAIVSTVAVSEAHGADPLSALTNGFQSAFATAVVFAAAGLLFAVALLGKLRVPLPAPAAVPAE